MAKRVVVEFYEFDPATRTITIPNKIIPQQNLLLVTNSKNNTVIFNFSDPDLGTTNYICPYSSYGTRFTLSYNTTTMSSSDALLIMEDKPAQSIAFDETVQDPVNKLRVATPESLIDTDFEYGLQPIKWECLNMVNNIPSFHYRTGGNSFAVTSMTTNAGSPYSLITVDCNEDTYLNAGDVVNVNYSEDYLANGTFQIVTAPTQRRFTYTSNGVVASSPYGSSVVVQGGDTFNSGNNEIKIIIDTLTSDDAASSMVTVTTTGKHGLLPGSPIMVKNLTTATVNGNWVVYDVPTTESFRFLTPNIQTGTSTAVIGASGLIQVRPEANFTHRSSDGGVLISSGQPQEGIAAIRQTRKYFRYQSGKGMQMSTGTKLTPTFDINSCTAVGTSVTIVTDQTLTISSGSTVKLEGFECNAGANNPWNGEFTVTNVFFSSNTIQLNLAEEPDDKNPGGRPQVTCTKWTGAVVRTGMYDYQNGFFFEYDGERIYCVTRKSTKELMGKVAVSWGSTTVTGTSSNFHKQLKAGDYVVIRGMSYLVLQVDSATSFEISPAYRGVGISGVRVNLTQDTKTPQSEWNLDKCDGAGPSGFQLDLAKMQMFYIDYSWYGAGRVRFGMRMTDGSITYCHNVVNNNVNNQAYMRSGNLPARYEVNNIGPSTSLYSGDVNSAGQDLASGASSLVIKDGQFWASSGTIILQQGTKSEVMTFTGKDYNSSLDAWNLTGLTRRQTGADTSNLTFTATEFEGGTAGTSSQTAVNFIECTCAPIISHWGTSVIMDGGYKEDRAIVFSIANGKQKGTRWSPTGVKTISGNTSCNLIAVRLAPSVDNSITGVLGARDIINRMQIKLASVGVVSRGSLLITGVLNPKTITNTTLPAAWQTTSIPAVIGVGSLAQYIDFTNVNQKCVGGEEIFSFLCDPGTTTFELTDVRELGTSIISGDGSTTTPGFPVGPDVLVITAQNITATNTSIVNCRISWTEAQA